MVALRFPSFSFFTCYYTIDVLNLSVIILSLPERTNTTYACFLFAADALINQMKGLHFPGSQNPQFCRLVLQRSRQLLKPVRAFENVVIVHFVVALFQV